MQYLKGFHHFFGRAKKASAAALKEQCDEIRERAPGQLALLFSEVVEPEKIKGKAGSRNSSYSADVTFWAMLGQVFRSGSLRDAVIEVQSHVFKNKADASLTNSTGSYSDARQRLPEASLKQVHERICQKMYCDEAFLNGRRIMVVDSTGVQIEDTQENQENYPQPSIQKHGCGFPVVKLIALMHLCKSTIEHYCESPLDADEGGMFDLELQEHLHAEDVLLADCGFCSYARLASLNADGVDVIMRLNSSRKWPDLSKLDLEVEWKRPRNSNCPAHLQIEELEQLPERLKVRYVRKIIQRKGFRDQEIRLVTTLMDADIEELFEIYLRRWDIELCFDDIKTSMKMDFIRVKSPEMARKMIRMHVIAYNLIRKVMLEAARKTDRPSHRISFKGSLDGIMRFTAQMQNLSKSKVRELLDKLYEVVGCEIVPLRLNRIEPRVRKRRPKCFDLMTHPRSVIRDKILAGQRL